MKESTTFEKIQSSATNNRYFVEKVDESMKITSPFREAPKTDEHVTEGDNISLL